MQLIFWQNIISPHQIPYIKHLISDERVTQVIVVVPRIINEERTKMGWDIKKYLEISTIHFIICPTDREVDALFEKFQQDSIHLFSGIRADQFVFDYFKRSIKFPVKRGIITEGPFTYQKPLVLHIVRFILQDYKYISKIDYVFAIGKGYEYFSMFSKKWKVFPFAYCVESHTCEVSIIDHSIPIKIAYCGSLIKLKNVISLIAALKILSLKYPIQLHIYGDGAEKESLILAAKKYGINDNVFFHGYYRVSDVSTILSTMDLLVLPSIYDGWGAVVNEAIMNGAYVVCSTECGASKLFINNNGIGVVHKPTVFDLENKLDNCLKDIDNIRERRQDRVIWSEKISGKAIAKYFIDCLDSTKHVTPPWK